MKKADVRTVHPQRGQSHMRVALKNSSTLL
nr:MAG TPA: hypothetical protein [Caudoviricetes sp.]